MSHQRWNAAPPYLRGEFHERAFCRDTLPEWDVRWHGLTTEARASFLNEVKIPDANDPAGYGALPSTEIERFSPAVLDELTAAGFVEVRSDRGRKPVRSVFAAATVYHFALRVRILGRFHLLRSSDAGAVKGFINTTYFHDALITIITEVLRRVGINEYVRLYEALDRYILTHHWADWIIAVLGDPLAAPIVQRLVEAGGTLPLAELLGKIDTPRPAAARIAVDTLVSHLVLFEDLDPATSELRVGMFPPVFQKLIEARRPRQRPPLLVCENVRDPGPDEGFLIADLRAVLLELASAPARLRQNHSLFQKEVPRFEGVIEPLPGWMGECLKVTLEGRLLQTIERARSLRFVEEVETGKACHLQLTPGGQEWLVGSMDDQFLAVVAVFRTPVNAFEHSLSSPHRYLAGIDCQGYSARTDSRFLGGSVVSLPVANGQAPGVWECKANNFDRLRGALDAIFSALPAGVFHPIDSFVGHAVFGENNPLLLGTKVGSGRVAIYRNGLLIPALADRLEETAKSLLIDLLGSRLIPLGCVRVALHERGIALARDPRCDAYFGRRIDRPGQPGAGAAESKVIVQPDYSVVIIGASAAPAAELLPFCERTSPGSGSGRGALVLKITRESVLQGIARGVPPAEILVRLKRHASHELPANVVREVEGWTGWVRHVAIERLTVIRCPDREAADRVMGALPRLAERIHETIVAIPPSKLTTLEHQKLLGHGILVGKRPQSGDADAEAGPEPKAKPKPKKSARKRRSYF